MYSDCCYYQFFQNCSYKKNSQPSIITIPLFSHGLYFFRFKQRLFKSSLNTVTFPNFRSFILVLNRVTLSFISKFSGIIYFVTVIIYIFFCLESITTNTNTQGISPVNKILYPLDSLFTFKQVFKVVPISDKSHP